MKTKLYLIVLLSSLINYAQGQIFRIGTLPTPTTSDSVALGRKTDGYWYEKLNSGSERPLKIQAKTNKLAGFRSISELRNDTLSLNTAPSIITLTDSLKNNTFFLNSGSTRADDGVTTIVTSSGLRYELFLADRRLTPEMFGAKGDSSSNDAVALQQWINAIGYELYLPAGKRYLCNTTLLRLNKGDVVIAGSGKIYFTGDTHGMQIINEVNKGTYGSVVLKDFTIESKGTKTGAKDGLKVSTQHLNRPGPIIEGITVFCKTPGQEWENMIHLHGVSGSSLSKISLFGASLSVANGITISNNQDLSLNWLPSVEHNISHINIQYMRRGVYLNSNALSEHSAGVEGVKISQTDMVAVNQGLYAISNGYGAPGINISDTHINAFSYGSPTPTGGEAIYTSGYQQINLSKIYVYVNKSDIPGSIPPLRAVYMKDVVSLYGDMYANTTDTTRSILELDGTGGFVNLDIHGAVFALNTYLVKATAPYKNSTFGFYRIWGGTLINNGPGGAVYPGSPKMQAKLTVDSDASAPADKSVLYYDAAGQTGYRAALPHVANVNSSTFTSASSFTVNPATTNLVLVSNGSSNATIRVPVNSMRVGQEITVKRYNSSSTGNLIIKSTDPTNNKVQDFGGTFRDSLTLPANVNAITLWFDGGHLEQKSVAANEAASLSYNSIANSITLTSAGSYTVNPAVSSIILVNNGSSAASVRIPISNMRVGQEITVKRYNNNSTGSLTLKTADPAFNKIQDFTRTFRDSLTLPANVQTVTYMFDGAHLEQKSVASDPAILPGSTSAYGDIIMLNAGQLQMSSGSTTGSGNAVFVTKPTGLTTNGYELQSLYGGVGYNAPLALQRQGGNVGIGTGIPNNKLEITHGTSGQSGLRFSNLTSASPASVTNQYKFLTVNSTGDVILGSLNSSTREGISESLWQRKGSFLQSTQNDAVIIGSNVAKTPVGYKLFVEEGILTEKVKVAVKTTSDWSDYVFKPNYSLKPLAEVEKYIQQHQHLPGVASASEVVEKGVDVAKMDAKLLEKIEELTLYSIQLEKENQHLRQNDKQRQADHKQQQGEIDELKLLVRQLIEKK